LITYGATSDFDAEANRVRRVICLGSAQGADALAWLLADALEARLAGDPAGGDVEIARCASPAQMAGLFAGATEILILDAVAQLPPGTLRVLTPDELDELPAHSSHGVGLVTVLELARALGDLPDSVTLVGLGVGEPDADPQPLIARYLLSIARRLALPD
jgi:hydrogenase maturation protease